MARLSRRTGPKAYVRRLTDLIREQASRETAATDPSRSTESMGPTKFPHPSSTPSPCVADSDWYQRAYRELQGIKHAIQRRQPWTLEELARIASGLVASLATNNALVQKVLQRDAGDYLLNNAVRVAIVSVKIAEALGYASAKLEQVAFAGLLHDLGMFALPDSLVHKPGTLTAEELQSVMAHPQQGSCLFEDIGGAYPWVGRVILQEHERWDGSGYPSRLAGDQIDEMALVIGLADVFDALISLRPYRSVVSPHQAIRTLVVNGKPLFPHHLLKALVDQLSIYPLGTVVRLNTGETGVVSQSNRQHPLRPILRVSPPLASGHAPLSKTVDLRAETSMHIVEVVPVG